MDDHEQCTCLIVAYCSSLVFVTVIKIHDQKYLGKKRFILFILCHNPTLREVRASGQKKTRDAGTAEEAMEETLLLVCSLMLLSLLSYALRTNCPGMAWPRVGWGLQINP